MPSPWTSSGAPSLGAVGIPNQGTVTLVEGQAFCISLASGDILAGLPHGVFYRDTRFLSELRLRVNGRSPEPLAANATDPFSAAFVLRDHPQVGYADSPLMVFRHRYVGRGLREDIVVRNFGVEPAFVGLELFVDVDFADLFEVKEGRVEKTGSRTVEHDATGITWSYRRGRFLRGARLELSTRPSSVDEQIVYEVIVPPGSSWSTCVQLTPIIDGEAVTPRYPCGAPVERSTPVVRLESWRAGLPEITSEHEAFDALLNRSMEDIAALRLFDPEHPDRPVIAAGAPWFMTLFGRDSLLTSWMAMLIDSDLALATLQTLARFQGRDVNPVTEEEPGRILHEMRFGETAELALGGGSIYYGSIDATPLFVMLLGELQRWGNRRDEVDALLPAADRALEWIEQFGDRDGDGYVEYQRTSDRGLRNQGWKDSWDSTRFASGRLAETPVALCEVQGYVFGALTARAFFAEEHGDDARAQRLRARAADLKARFNRDFWLEEHGWYAMGLDRDKRPIDALVSNMGHCLWTGIVDDDKAPIVAASLVGKDLFSGWGIRTLATSMAGFNPISYHNGSVWPHDNALAAAGLMRYGLVEEAHRVIGGIVDAASSFGNRMPELFSGLSRADYRFPVSYPTSCSPQAWSAASPLLFLRSLLNFYPNVRNAELHVEPRLPEWMGRVVIERIPLMGGFVALEADGDKLESVSTPDGLTVVPERPAR
jgi:glycogen debranching enzyme